MTDIQTALFALRDPAYQAFQSKLIPTIDPQTVIGGRMPALRKLAREIAGTPVAEGFLQELPHRYYEENNLHGLLISAIPGYDGAVAALETFLPYVDNWATCDLLSPKAFRKHPPELRKQIRRWVEDAHTYTVRFGLGMLMSFYLDEGFQMEDLDLAAGVRREARRRSLRAHLKNCKRIQGISPASVGDIPWYRSGHFFKQWLFYPFIQQQPWCGSI